MTGARRDPVLERLLALVAALLVLDLAVLLRARSDGPAPGTVALVGTGVLLWLTASCALRRLSLLRLLALTGPGLVLAQALLRLSTTGVLSGDGVRGVVCCPSADVPVGAGALALLLAHAGWLLLAVQLASAAALAAGLDRAGALLRAAGCQVAGLLGGGRLLAAVRALLAVPLPLAATLPCVPLPEPPALVASTFCTPTVTRRGPPRGRLLLPSLSLRAA